MYVGYNNLTGKINITFFSPSQQICMILFIFKNVLNLILILFKVTKQLSQKILDNQRAYVQVLF